MATRENGTKKRGRPTKAAAKSESVRAGSNGKGASQSDALIELSVAHAERAAKEIA